MDEEKEDNLPELPERLKMKIESLEKPDKHKEDIIQEFNSEKQKFEENYTEEITKKYERRIEEVVMDLVILRKKLQEESEK